MIPLSQLMHGSPAPLPNKQPAFVGGKECSGCHKREYDLWKNSNHDKAMEVASDHSVLGNFNDVEVEWNGNKHRFYKRDGKFFVYTAGVAGKMSEFQITHTFGVRPLQQYLVPFGKGKYQCLPIAWDTIKKRWFDMAGMVYRAEDLKPDSWFYWTNQAQNWNGMCAECHSTNLQKNYYPEADSFKTTWSDIDVNCEACHGPGANHLEWANLPEGARDHDGSMGLVLRTSGTTSKQYIQSCAPCHSRRTSFGPNNHTENEYYNNYRPQNISPPLYYADGQILDEVYAFASFTQSKMYMNEVNCSDCHDSHSLKFRFEGNALCTQCHRAEEFDTFQHHFHKYENEAGEPVINKFAESTAVGEGVRCVNCHMPGKYYMGIDFRRDHSLRIPRPDLSLNYDTPNACNDCHADKSFQWSENYLRKYFGERKKPAYASVLADGFLQKAGADTSLIKLIRSELYPEIVRATAIQYLSAYENPAACAAIREMLGNPEPIIRERALDGFHAGNAQELVKVLFPLLQDPVRMVRISAAANLSTLPGENFTADQFKILTTVLEEYLNTLLYTSDFPSGKYNLGNYYANRGDYVRAEKYYDAAIQADRSFYPAKLNLALLCYNISDLEKAETLFLDLINNHPEVSEGNYYLGLLYAEQKKYKEAAEILEQATVRRGVNPRIYYNLGLIYQYLGIPGKAESSLLKAYSLSPDEFDVLYALADFYIKKQDYTNAEKYAQLMMIKHPANPAGEQLLNYLRDQ
jgi:tetratricopeptide (TPR) repeat protein